ncbi:hypothetical protein [Fusobacterium necrophorum]|nr:hypothetical protein [Fusobacterium necrophorum]
MTGAGYFFTVLILSVCGVYLFLRNKYKKNKPKDLYKQAKKDLKK